MNYADIKNFNERCKTHPNHQHGMISSGMICDRLYEEVEELREYIEGRTWVGLTDEEISAVLGSDIHDEHSGELLFIRAIEVKLKEKNT